MKNKQHHPTSSAFHKKMICLALVLFLLIGIMPIKVSAKAKTYLALGDSISTGYGLSTPDTQSFAALIRSEIGEDTVLINKAVVGETTASLSENLEKRDYQSAIAEADVITLTIGGNDLMALLYEYLAEKLSTEEAPMTAAEMKKMLTESGGDLNLFILTAVTAAINDPDFDAYFLPTNTGITSIAADIASVISTIKLLNPHALLVVATQYNPYEYLAAQAKPFSVIPLAQAIVKVSETLEKILVLNASDGITNLNERILADANGRYQVADVYTAFHTAFNAQGARLCNASMSITPLGLNLDFHPNAEGHALIASVFSRWATLEANVSYINADGTMQTQALAAKITSDTVTLGENDGSEHWYVVGSHETIASRITVKGDVHLILSDGASLTINGGIRVANTDRLTIYGQSNGSGKLTAIAEDKDAAIGGSSDSLFQNGGTVIINGGVIQADGVHGAGIGGGYGGNGCHVTVNGGTITATSVNAAGIGGSDATEDGNVIQGELMLTGGATVILAAAHADGSSPVSFNETARGTYHYLNIKDLPLITLDHNDGTASSIIQKTQADGTLPTLPTPARIGFLSDGWYDAANGGNLVTSSTVFAFDTTIYAHWKECDHAASITTPTCTESAICSVCGGMMSALGHAFTETLIADETTHYYNCARCDAKTDESEHHFIHPVSCNNGTHIATCICGKNSIINCFGGTATCLAEAICNDCGIPYGNLDLDNHDFDAAWLSDKDTHWQTCSRCAEISAKSAHIYDENNICICGMKKEQTAVIVLIVGCIVLACGGGLSLWWFVFNGKKQKKNSV